MAKEFVASISLRVAGPRARSCADARALDKQANRWSALRVMRESLFQSRDNLRSSPNAVPPRACSPNRVRHPHRRGATRGCYRVRNSFGFSVSFRQEQLKLAARTCQTGHDGSDRNAGNLRDFFVRQSFQFAQSNGFPEFRRQLLDGSAHCLSVACTIECDARIQRRDLPVQFLIEGDGLFIHTIALESGEGGVAHNAQKPCSAVFTAKTFEKSKRAQCRFLHDVLGVLIVAHEESRQVVSP